MIIKLVDFNNYEEAIKIQNEIFPHEDGTINILASLDRDLFMKKTEIFYEDDNVKYYIAYINNESVGITGIYQESPDTDPSVRRLRFQFLPGYGLSSKGGCILVR